jgi:hypothetical protein
MNISVLDGSLGKVEGPLEFSVIGVVGFITISDQVEIASSLVYFNSKILSPPKS